MFGTKGGFFTMNQEEYTIVECEVVEGNTLLLWRFWCPYCKHYHTHGSGEGMRASHCFNPKSPLYSKDYFLVLKQPTKKPLEASQ